MSEQPQRPADDDRAAWSVYWQARGMPWRTEPEIDEPRQHELAERRAIPPDIERGIYPFRDERGSIRLYRADIEWLLATHESDGMRGPVDWSDESQRGRRGLDLRGADLHGEMLRYLPLARTFGGWLLDEAPEPTPEQLEAAAVHLEGADLRGGFERSAHLEGARFTGAHLEGASLYRAKLERAGVDYAYLWGASLARAHLESASLAFAHLEGATLRYAHLEGVNLSGARLTGAQLADDVWSPLHERLKDLPQRLPPTDLRGVFFDSATVLENVVLSDARTGCAQMAGIHWGEVDLSVVDWQFIDVLGDERIVRAATDERGIDKDHAQRRAEFETAIRANRQLATVLRGQGINEEGDRFAYRAQVLRRQVFRRSGHFGRYLGSLLLDVVSGYGYKPLRSLIAYVVIISLFAGAYLLNAQFAAPHLTWDEALVLSVSSFHGRGFFTTGVSLSDTLARLAAGEAIIGLLIEITFIATFTQRFFAR